MRLYSSVIRLLNLYSVTILPPGGQHAHAAFLDIVRAVDSALSQRLHDLNGRKPFTVSSLMGLPRQRETAEVYLREGWECWLRVTLLNEELFRTFIEYFLDGRGKEMPKIRLGDAHFAVSEILTTPGSHPWAGYVSVEELQKRLDEPAPEKFTFELHTPTSFRLQDKEVATLPTPKLVFGNLAGAWRALTGENNVEAVEKYAEKNLRMGTYKLRTERLFLHNNPQLGSVGRLEFVRTDTTDNPTARALNLLADLAFFAGLGRKTAQGMGMARRLVN
ncbi:MAG TPA: CRISPR-associated endoribonuclease Cas6 [Anaerolineales bacterium]|nr:CRISPR-associated endoribonuclease Cas6 [Anaerolineales bacterium]